jgi:hypothetical protein
MRARRLRHVEGRLEVAPKCVQRAVALQHGGQHVQVIDGLRVAAGGNTLRRTDEHGQDRPRSASCWKCGSRNAAGR